MDKKQGWLALHVQFMLGLTGPSVARANKSITVFNMKNTVGYRAYQTYPGSWGLESEDLNICLTSTMCCKYSLRNVREIPKFLEFNLFCGTQLPYFPLEFLQKYS